MKSAWASVQLWGIILGDGVKVVGILLFGWNLFIVIYAFWFEELIRSVFYSLRLILATVGAGRTGVEYKNTAVAVYSRFFVLFIYLVFIAVVPGILLSTPEHRIQNIMVVLMRDVGFDLAMALCFLSHAVALYRFVASGRLGAARSAEVDTSQAVFTPEHIILHISIIFGSLGWAVASQWSGTVAGYGWADIARAAFMTIFMALKVGVEYWLHRQRTSVAG